MGSRCLVKLNFANQARARAEKSALALLLRRRATSNASGVHNNKADRRARTRQASKSKAIKEQL